MTDPGRDLRTAPPSPGDPAATVTGLYAGAELHVGQLVAQRFRIEQLLGMGGMGVVYRAFDEQLGVPVALKLLRPEVAARPDALQRFRQELLLARQVSSPHVVRIHDLVQHEGQWLISMDFVPGVSLERYLDGRGAMPVDDAAKIARQLALGLAAAHQRDVVHRDLKPANVLLTDALDAYITDFGVARSIGSARMTGTGTVVGTPEYLSPEQARAEAVDHRSDLYALGLILYEMLAGRLPHEPTSTPAEMLAHRMSRALPPITQFRRDLPRWMVELVTRLTQLRPSHRLRDAQEVVRAIDEKRVPAMAGARRRRVASWLVAALVVVAVGYAWSERARWLPSAPVANAPTAAGPNAGAASSTAAQNAANAIAPVSTIVLPVSVAAGAAVRDGDLARALDALIVETLRARGVATAGVDDVRRAMSRLSIDDDAATRQATRLAEAFGASAIVAPSLVHENDRWRVTFERLAAGTDAARTGADPAAAAATSGGAATMMTAAGSTSGSATPTSPIAGATALARADSGLVTIDALGAALGQAVASLGLETIGEPEPTPTFPASLDALSAFGQAERANASFDAATAATAYEAATTAAPNFALAWLRRIELARRNSVDAAAAVAQSALGSLRGASGVDADRVRAAAASLAGDADGALARYARLRERRPYDRALRFDEALALSSARRSPEAIAALQALAESDPQHGDAWLMLGREWIRGGEVQRGVDEALVRAQLAFTRSGDQRGLADTAHALGVGYERLGQVDEARAQFERAAEARIALGEPVAAASSLRNVAWIEAIRGDFAKADASLDLAAKTLGDHGDVAARAALANDRGLIAEERGDFRAALPSFREALALRESLGDAAAVAESLGNVGFAYGQIGEFDNAAVYLARAGDEYQRLDDASGRIRIDQSLALVEIARGEWKAARERLERTLADSETMQLVEEQAVTHIRLATLARLEGRIGDAITHADRALELFGKRDDARGQAEARLIRAGALLDVGAVDESAKTLAPFDIEAPGNTEQQAMWSILRAHAAEVRGDLPAALAQAQTAIGEAGEAASLPVELEARLAAAQVALRMSGHDAATPADRNAATAHRAAAVKSLATIRDTLARYPSKPHAWHAAELEIALAPPRVATATYRDVTAAIDALPAYGRTGALHAAAAAAFAAAGDESAAKAASDAAAAARQRMLDSTPAALRPPSSGAGGADKER